jgi:high-affinity nickel-transport protein
MSRLRHAFTRAEWRRLGAFSAVIVALHLAGWGIVLALAGGHPMLIGLGTLAYTFGLRHAFDADHIAAIDNTTRKMLQEGKRPLGVGFAFSLGHSTVVLVLSVGLAVAAGAVSAAIPHLQAVGGTIGAGVSGTFLIMLGILNLLVLADVLKLARGLREGGLDEEQLERRLLDRGFMNRFFLGRVAGRVRETRHMYPLGILFGLGFDTASEVGLLAITAGAASGQVPVLGILALPLLFAGGMALMDTIDGVFMARAYGWAFSSPARKLYYNITVTSLSVTVALGIGGIELLQVLTERLGLDWGWLDALNFETLGYVMVGLFVATWVVATVVWKARRIEQRWTPVREEPA